jgi:hypothetical protein
MYDTEETDSLSCPSDSNENNLSLKKARSHDHGGTMARGMMLFSALVVLEQPLVMAPFRIR